MIWLLWKSSKKNRTAQDCHKKSYLKFPTDACSRKYCKHLKVGTWIPSVNYAMKPLLHIFPIVTHIEGMILFSTDREEVQS